MPLNPLIEFAIKNLENSNNDVRVAAHNLIVECYKVVGSGKITPLLGGVKQIQLDMLMADFNNVLGVPQDDALRQEMDNIGNKKKAGDKGKKAGKDEQTKVCEFCGRTDKNFLESAKFDMHLWKECPMLTTCKECALVTEISS